MTTSRDANPYADLISADDAVGLALAADLEAMHHVPVPISTFDLAARRAVERRPRVLRHWRPLAVGAAVAAILAAGVLIPATWGGETEMVSAQEILQNAQTAMDQPTGYHRTYQTIYTGEPSPNVPYQVQVAEVWYRDPSHHRVEIKDESGRLLAGIILNGDEGWHYFTDGILRVIHFGPNSAFVQAMKKGLKPPASLDEAASYLADCGTAPSIMGEATVIGRPAYMVENCGNTLWIDKDSFFILGGGPGSATDDSRDSSTLRFGDNETETTTFEWDVHFRDSTFDYQPPPGTFVVEQDF